ncbi:MAG: hypothetical protein IJZ53_08615 [Tyzzerella sp.]|nr:hypothetical protein [Tyzzerella sp.]
MKKKVLYTEMAYVLGLILLAIGNSLMAKADFGISIVIAPAYLVYLKLSSIFSFFTFGMAEYILQTILLIMTMLVLRKFRISFLFAFVTAVVYGLILDVVMLGIDWIPHDTFAMRVLFFIVALFFNAAGVSMHFHTYLPPAAYEFFVKEVSGKLQIDINKFKRGFDFSFCVIGIVMSFCFFGLWHFEGIKLGTVICVLFNSFAIAKWSKFYEQNWEIRDKWGFRQRFEK